MREIITLQIGQCGNQIGNDFWSQLCLDHGLSHDGYEIKKDLEDKKQIFFYQAEDNKFIPRALLVDLEPRVIANGKFNFYNDENIFIGSEGCGAGNNWAHGYNVGKTMKEDVLDALQREAEGCDMMEAIFMLHSVAGGTGSGFGSLLLEEMRNIFPKKILQNYSVFPNNTDVSDVVVQPYNSILTLMRLYNLCDSVIVMDNAALGKIATDYLRIKMPNLDQINFFISTVISESTSTIRFPTYMFPDVSSLNSITIPYHSLKFITPSYSPFYSSQSKVLRKMTVDEIIRRNYTEKMKMASLDTSKAHAHISVVNILNNVDKMEDIQKAQMKNYDINFVPWMPPFPHIIAGRNSKGRMSGLTLSNYTGISGLFKKICDQFDILKSRNAYIESYRRFYGDLSLFDEARETVQKLIEEYQSSELASFKNK